MADLLLGVSQLLTQEPNNHWQPDPDIPDVISQHIEDAAANNIPQPQVAETLVGVPQFAAISASSTKLQRLQETLPQQTETLSLERLLSTATDSSITVDDLQAGLNPSGNLEFVFEAAAGERLFEGAIPTASEPSPAVAFDFDDVADNQEWAFPADAFEPAVPAPEATSSEQETAAISVPAETEKARTAPQADTPAAPTFTVPRDETILSYATTPSALALAEQQLQPLQGPRPGSGSQMYQQRQAALNAGTLYTRLSPDSFYEQWVNASAHPTYEQWQALLAHEASAIANGQGNNSLTIVVGDSLSQWLPPDMLPQDRFWLNQGISGDTTQGVLNRIHTFANTRPDTIHVMAGVNDLKNGASDVQVLANLEQIMQRLRQQHPDARIIVHSILPTRLASIPSDRIRNLNRQIEQKSQGQQVVYLDLHPSFTDDIGDLRYELTTDGIHLSRLGYQVWQIAMLAL